MYDWNWNIIWLYKYVFIQGAAVTLGLSLFAVVLGTIVGVLIAFLRGSDNPVFSFIARLYIETFRALPILVVLIWIYYVLPILVDVRLSSFTTAIVALSLHLAAFVAETVRAGVESIPRSQYESGVALGMSYMQTMRHIIMPQAVRNMLPNLLGLYINEIKNSSLASMIAVDELMHRGNTMISDTFRPLEIYTTIAIVYLILILPLVALLRWTERRFSKGIKSTSLSYAASN